MPEFIAQHVPPGLDAFTTGYLEAIEWLVDDEDRNKVTGFHPDTIQQSKKECEDFIRENREDLKTYVASDRSMCHAGHDFWLSRNGHGTGFWDRGSHPVFDSLHQAAKLKGEMNIFVDANGKILIE